MIQITTGSSTDTLKLKVIVGTQEYVIDKTIEDPSGKHVISIKYQASSEEESAVAKIEKISVNMPFVYTIKVQ